MRTSQVFASILAYAAAALGGAAPGPAAPTPLAAATPTASVNGPDPANLPALFTPPPGPIPQAAQLSGDVTIGITNQLPGAPALTIVGASNAGVKPPRTPINGQFSRTTSIVVPSGWAGAFTVDKASGGFNSQGSRIEGNWGVNDPLNQVYVDISYVTGYSVPIVCGCGTSASATPVTGCNKDLFGLNACPSGQQQGPSTAAVCLNRSPTAGPPQSFFAPCRGGAYTYPNDNGAVGVCTVNNVSCCVGYSCVANPKQPSGNSKRDIVKLMAARRGLDASTEGQE